MEVCGVAVVGYCEEAFEVCFAKCIALCSAVVAEAAGAGLDFRAGDDVPCEVVHLNAEVGVIVEDEYVEAVDGGDEDLLITFFGVCLKIMSGW